MEWAHRTFKINKLRSQTFQNLASSNDDPEETGLMLIVKSRSSIDVHQIDGEEEFKVKVIENPLTCENDNDIKEKRETIVTIVKITSENTIEERIPETDGSEGLQAPNELHETKRPSVVSFNFLGTDIRCNNSEEGDIVLPLPPKFQNSQKRIDLPRESIFSLFSRIANNSQRPSIFSALSDVSHVSQSSLASFREDYFSFSFLMWFAILTIVLVFIYLFFVFSPPYLHQTQESVNYHL